MTSATRLQVHTWPRKPYASGPRSTRAGSWANCSALRRGCRPGAGWRRNPSTPCSRPRLSHWLTAPAVTPRAAAMSFFQLPGTLSPPLAPIELRHLGLHGANISSFYASTQRSVERACERARQTGLWVVGHGHRRIDGAEVFAVPSMRHPETQWWLVAVVDGRLACDCPAGRQGRMCQHRGAVHAFLAAGLLAARSARQTASSPRLRTDTRPFSIWK